MSDMDNINPPQLNNYSKSTGSPHVNRETIATNIKGSVKWFHRVRGFGFITRDDNNEDIFVHYSSLKPVSINLARAKKRLNLMEKEKVQFDIVKTEGGYEAVNVVGKNGYLIIDIIAYKRDIPPFDLEIINDARVTGKVKWFNVKIKYGFIHCDYNNEDVFVHASAIIKNNPNKYKPSLNEGEPVEFDILKRADGKLEAVNVTGPNGTEVEGSRYSPDKKENTEKVFVEQDVIGKVKWFNVKAGFGFINRNDNGQDVYAHYSAIVNKNPDHRVRSLADGELVRFNIVEGDKGAEASDVTGLNGDSVQGSKYARPKSQSAPGSVNSNRRLVMGGSSAPSNRAPPPPYQPRGQHLPQPPPPPYSSSQSGNYKSPRQNNYQKPSQTSNRRSLNGYQNNLPPVNINGNGYPQRINNYASNFNESSGHRTKPRPLNSHNYENDSRNQYQNNYQMGYQPMRQQYNYDPRYPNANDNYIGAPRNDYSAPLQNGFNSTTRGKQSQYSTVDKSSRVYLAERVSGYVKWYNFKNGFGFVTRNDDGQDIFVHKTGIQNAGSQHLGLDDAELVEFDVCQDETRLVAVNVTGPNGSNLRGSKYANLVQNPQVSTTKVYRRRNGENGL